MAKYDSESLLLENLYRAGDKDAMVKLAVRMAQRLNKRFQRLRKSGVNPESSLAYRQAQHELGMEHP